MILTETTPNCRYCGKKLRPNYDLCCAVCGEHWSEHGILNGKAKDCSVTWEQMRRGDKGKKVLRGYGRGDLGLFCSDRHAVWFAELAVKAGFRVTKGA